MFLKIEDLTNGSIKFRYHGHVGPETKKKKAGGTYDIYTFQLEITSDSRVGQYFINKQGAEYGDQGSRLIDCDKGDIIQAYVNGDWVNWRVLPNESEPSTTRSSSSEDSRQVKPESELTRKVTTREFDETVRQICMAHAGAGQAYIKAVISNSGQNISNEDQLISDAMNFAKKFREANMKLSIDVASRKS